MRPSYSCFTRSMLAAAVEARAGLGADAGSPGATAGRPVLEEGPSISFWMAAANEATVPMGVQLSESVETSSLPRSWPSSSILTMTPSSNGPNTLPERRRTWKRFTLAAPLALLSLAASSMKLSISRPSALPAAGGGGRGAERSTSRSSPAGHSRARWGRTRASRPRRERSAAGSSKLTSPKSAPSSTGAERRRAAAARPAAEAR